MSRFILKSPLILKVDEQFINDTNLDLFSGFTFGKLPVVFERGVTNACCCGNEALPVLPAGKEYAVSITENGFSVVGADYGGLSRGVYALLSTVQFLGDELYLEETYFESEFTVKNRMVHLCVFPETTLYFLRRTIRLCGVLGFSQVILEFWGTLKYDFEPALAWKNYSFTKDEIRPVIEEIRALGMEPIPMFNHLGHATGSRLSGGKHVVLDQKPSLYNLFTPDGWAWNVESEQALTLLKSVRSELYELFGETKYFHLGLDEAYIYAHSPSMRAKLPDFLSRITHEVENEGARPMLWMDMFLPDESGTTECCKCTPEETDAVLSAIAPSSVLVDWQYGLKEAPIKSSTYLIGRGFDIMGAPWYGYDNCKAHIKTCVDYNLFGVMLTTWHTLNWHTPSILRFARLCGAHKTPWSDISGSNEETSTLLRKVSVSLEPKDGYLDAGWCEKQIAIDIN